MARDEKNYYQDTPKQIRNKINVYKRFYPAEWQAFTDSLQKNKMEVEWLVYAYPRLRLPPGPEKQGVVYIYRWGQPNPMESKGYNARARVHTHSLSLTFHFGEDTVSQRLQFIFFWGLWAKPEPAVFWARGLFEYSLCADLRQGHLNISLWDHKALCKTITSLFYTKYYTSKASFANKRLKVSGICLLSFLQAR